MTSENSSLKDLIEGFRLSCQTEGKSPKTVEWYGSFLSRFLGFLVANKMPLEVPTIDRTHIRGFIRHLQTEAKMPRGDRPLSGAAVQGYTRTLKSFFAWADREGYVESNPILKIPVPKAETKILSTFSSDQIEGLLAACRNCNISGQRNLAMMLVMLDTGLRVSELVGIDLDDVDLNEGQVMIRKGKGGRGRVVPVGSLVQRSLWKYINGHRPRPLTQNITRLFLSAEGLPLTRSGVQQMVRRCGKRAGVSGVCCSPHTFRHTFARSYLLRGGDVFSLQKILGHSSLASVRICLNLFAGDVKEQHRRFSPVANYAPGSLCVQEPSPEKTAPSYHGTR